MAQQYYRFAIVVDKQQVGDTSPAITEIFSDTSPVFALPNTATLDRFRILYMSPVLDVRRMVLDSASGVPTQNAHIEVFKKTSIKVTYNGSATTDIQKNGMYFVLLSNTTTGTSDFVGVARIAYTDV